MLNRQPDPYPYDDPSEELLRVIGGQLRDTRMRRGEDLYDVADYLRIKPSYLAGLEEGDLSVMPGRPYALGFLRTYADYLGLDGEQAVAHVKAANDSVTVRTELNYRTPLPENRRPKGALLVLSLVLAGAVYGGWYVVHDRERTLFEVVAEVPEHLRDVVLRSWPGGSDEAVDLAAGTGEPMPDNVVPALPEQSGLGDDAASDTAAASDLGLGGALGGLAEVDGEVDSGPAAGASTGTVSPRPATGGEAAEAGSRPDPILPALALTSRNAASDGQEQGNEPAAASGLRLSAEVLMAPAAAPAPIASTGAAEASAPTPSAPVDGGSSAAEMLAALAQDGDSSGRQPQAFGGGDEVRVILRARESSWIQVRSESRDYVRTRTLQPGDTFLVPNRSDLALWTGNAGGLEVLVDGRPIAELGGRGVVVRDVSLDPEQLLARGGG